MNMINNDMHNIVDNITVLFMSFSYSGQCLPSYYKFNTFFSIFLIEP